MDKMSNKFSIEFCSDVDYEELVADICYGYHTIAMISQDKGGDNMEIQLYSCLEYGAPLKFPLDGFVNILALAKKELIASRKPADESQ